MSEAFIIDAVRTPVGKKGGSLAQIHPADLGAHALKALMDRVGIDPALVEDVVLDERGIDADAIHERLERVGAEVGRMDLGQRSALLADGGADGVDDECFTHWLLSPRREWRMRPGRDARRRRRRWPRAPRRASS